MKNNIKWTFVVILSMTVFFNLQGPLMAQAVWVDGSVTRKAWIDDRHPRIEVDGVKYMLMPDAKTYMYYKRGNGAYNEKSISIREIRKGQKIRMRVLGHNIYQIIMFK